MPPKPATQMFLSPIGLNNSMKKAFSILFFSFLLCVSAFSQEAVKIDEFKRITCGDFSARIDGLMSEYDKFPSSKIYVIYYGGQHRIERSNWNDKTRSYDKTKLKKPHRYDGLNWARTIPLYIKDRIDLHKKYSGLDVGRANDELIKENIFLVDGGFRKEIEVEIWLVPKGVELPEPSPTVSEKDIKFRKNKPNRTPRMACCYGDCL